LVVTGWPEDLEVCLDGLLAHASAEVRVDVAYTGESPVVAEQVRQVAGRFAPVRLHELGAAGWGPAQQKLLSLDTSQYYVTMDVSSVLLGDAISPLVELAENTGAVATGWKGVNVALDKNWYEFEDAPAGEVDALLGYLMLVRRDAALSTPPSEKAIFYRNADMEWSLALRAAGGKLFSYGDDLPIEQRRHRGYHDTDPSYRDEQSKVNYLRLLKRFKGKTEILAARA
jgi:hypothetical protein